MPPSEADRGIGEDKELPFKKSRPAVQFLHDLIDNKKLIPDWLNSIRVLIQDKGTMCKSGRGVNRTYCPVVPLESVL